MQRLFTPEIVIEARLCESLKQAAGLGELRIGRHVVRNAQRERTGQFFVRKLWVAEIRPPTAHSVCLASVVFDQQTKLILAIPEITEDRIDVVSRLLTLESEWSDPVSRALTTLDLWSGGNGISFGGYSYTLFVDTSDITAGLRLGNLQHLSRIAIQDALLEVVRLFITAEAGQSVMAFFDPWESAIRAVAQGKQRGGGSHCLELVETTTPDLLCG
jgi:hypothetical protein